MRSRRIPPSARHLRTYAEFESYLSDFARGHYPFIWAVGRPGTGKTEAIRASIRGQTTGVYYRNSGQLTPLRFYIDCYRHRGLPIILDDAEHLLDTPVGAKLVSALGDTSPVKHLSYGTTSSVLGDVPDEFLTTSKLAIIANRATPHEAIRSRATILYFDPTNLEIHRAVARWYWCQEVFDWFGQHLCQLPLLDTRWYVVADLDRRAGRDWRRIILDTHGPDPAAGIIQDLETDPAYPTREDKARRFVERMGDARGASRASYFRLRRRLEAEGRLVARAVPPITLTHTRPPATPSLAELDSMEVAAPAEVLEEPRPLDVPTREEFARPIRGGTTTQASPARQGLDDVLPWEARRQESEEEEDE